MRFDPKSLLQICKNPQDKRQGIGVWQKNLDALEHLFTCMEYATVKPLRVHLLHGENG
jgi:hypothetical protein